MTSRRQFLTTFAALLPLPAAAQAPWGVVHELVGDVALNDFPLTRQSALQSGQTIRTGADGRGWFSIGADAKIIERFSAAADHPVALEFPEGEYLKGLLVLKT